MSHHGHHNSGHNARPLINALRDIRQEMHHPIIPPPHHGHHGHHSPHHVGADVGAALLVGGVLGAGVALAASSQPTTVSSQPRPLYVQQQPQVTTTTYVQQPLQTTYVQPTVQTSYVPTIPQQQPYYYQQQPTIQQQQVYSTIQPQQIQQQQTYTTSTLQTQPSYTTSTFQTQPSYTTSTLQTQPSYTTSTFQTQPLTTQTTIPQTTYTTTNVNTVQYQQKSTTFQDNANYYGSQKEGEVSKNIEKEGEVSTTTTTSLYSNQYQPLNPFYGGSSSSTTTSTSELTLSSPSTTNSTTTTTLNTQQQINPFYVYGDITKVTTTDTTETKVSEVSEKLSKLEVSSKSLVWSQPLEDAKPSLISSKSDYTDEDAFEDAKKLRAAMKGFGCDDGVICEITGSRNHKQRLQIKKMFAKVDDKGERSLLKDLESELGGDFRKTVLPLYSEPGSADAKWMKDALDGRGYNSDLLLEILCTRTNEELKQLKEAWAKLEKKTLVDRISDETSKFFSAGHFKTFCTNILEANRPLNGPVDDKAAAADAEHLNRALSQDKKGDAKTIFVTIFTQRSWRHIAAVAGKFQQISQKYTLEAAIKHEWSDSDTSKGLRIILEFVTAPYDYWAKRLHNSMAGLGTDDCTLQRIIISRCEIDLANVAQVFADRYGKGKTLKSWIENDTKGHYEKLLLKLAGY